MREPSDKKVKIDKTNDFVGTDEVAIKTERWGGEEESLATDLLIYLSTSERKKKTNDKNNRKMYKHYMRF